MGLELNGQWWNGVGMDLICLGKYYDFYSERGKHGGLWPEERDDVTCVLVEHPTLRLLYFHF